MAAITKDRRSVNKRPSMQGCELFRLSISGLSSYFSTRPTLVLVDIGRQRLPSPTKSQSRPNSINVLHKALLSAFTAPYRTLLPA